VPPKAAGWCGTAINRARPAAPWTDRRPRPPHRFLVSDVFTGGELRVRGKVLAHVLVAGCEPIAKDELKHGFRRASRFAGEAF